MFFWNMDIHSGVFPDNLKKSNIVPIHKKNDKQ